MAEVNPLLAFTIATVGFILFSAPALVRTTVIEVNTSLAEPSVVVLKCPAGYFMRFCYCLNTSRLYWGAWCDGVIIRENALGETECEIHRTINETGGDTSMAKILCENELVVKETKVVSTFVQGVNASIFYAISCPTGFEMLAFGCHSTTMECWAPADNRYIFRSGTRNETSAYNIDMAYLTRYDRPLSNFTLSALCAKVERNYSYPDFAVIGQYSPANDDAPVQVMCPAGTLMTNCTSVDPVQGYQVFYRDGIEFNLQGGALGPNTRVSCETFNGYPVQGPIAAKALCNSEHRASDMFVLSANNKSSNFTVLTCDPGFEALLCDCRTVGGYCFNMKPAPVALTKNLTSCFIDWPGADLIGTGYYLSLVCGKVIQNCPMSKPAADYQCNNNSWVPPPVCFIVPKPSDDFICINGSWTANISVIIIPVIVINGSAVLNGSATALIPINISSNASVVIYGDLTVSNTSSISLSASTISTQGNLTLSESSVTNIGNITRTPIKSDGCINFDGYLNIDLNDAIIPSGGLVLADYSCFSGSYRKVVIRRDELSCEPTLDYRQTQLVLLVDIDETCPAHQKKADYFIMIAEVALLFMMSI